MSAKSVVREVLEKSGVEKCWRGVLQRSVGEACCRELLEKGLVKTCWKRVL